MEFLFYDWLTKPVWLWLSFLAVVVVLLVLDLGVLNKGDQEIGIAKSLKLSAFYVTLGVLYSGFVWWSFDDARDAALAAGEAGAAQLLPGFEAAKLYLTGFVVEKSLAMDNVFVIAMIFGYFAIPRQYQHRVLFWGILGVIVLRGVMIGLGATLISQFGWVLYIFAAFLIYTGVMMWVNADKEFEVGESAILRFVKSRFRVTEELHGHDFFVKKTDPKTGRMATFMTPLMVALIMVEIVDVVFAVDSVPAIFAITTDPFIVYTSNIFAILGLRALYFALAAMVHRFHYLKYALAVLLMFIGSKIFLADLLGFEGGKFPATWSLAATFAILGTGVFYSLYKTRGLTPEQAPKPTVGYPLGTREVRRDG